MLNRKEKVNIVTRILTFCTCIVFCTMMIYYTESVRNFVNDHIIPYMVSSEYNVDASGVKRINYIFDSMLKENKDINSIVLYKFVSSRNSQIYNGQLDLASKSRNKELSTNKTIEPLYDNTYTIQEILLNKIHYDNISTIRMLCQNKFDTTRIYSCEKYQKIGNDYKSVVSIPVVDEQRYMVIGYIMVTLNSDYDNHQVEGIVNSLQSKIRLIQPIIKKES